MAPIAINSSFDSYTSLQWIGILAVIGLVGVGFMYASYRASYKCNVSTSGFLSSLFPPFALILLLFFIIPGILVGTMKDTISSVQSGWKDVLRDGQIIPGHALDLPQYNSRNLILRPVSDSAREHTKATQTGEYERLSMFPDGMKILSFKEDKGHPRSVFLTPIQDGVAVDDSKRLVYAVSAVELSLTEHMLLNARNELALNEIHKRQMESRSAPPVVVHQETQEEKDKKDFEASQAR